MAAIISPAVEPARDRGLISLLMRGGAATVRVNLAVPGTYFLVPEDDKRTYLGFSLPAPFTPIVLCPNEDAIPAGFTLHTNQSIIEFGGAIPALLTKGAWRCVADVATIVDVTVITA